MKPTVSQLLMTASTILCRLIENGNEANDEQNVKRAVTLATMLADEIPETDPIPDKEKILNTIKQIYGGIQNKFISKTQLANALQTKLETGKRNTENIILWADMNGYIIAEPRGNGVNYSLA